MSNINFLKSALDKITSDLSKKVEENAASHLLNLGKLQGVKHVLGMIDSLLNNPVTEAIEKVAPAPVAAAIDGAQEIAHVVEEAVKGSE